MKSLIVVITLITSFHAHAMSDRRVEALYSLGKAEEKSLDEAQLSESMKKSINEKLDKKAESLSSIWDETVWKGSYVKLGPVLVDKEVVKALYYKNELIGFGGAVIADAAFGDDCKYNNEINEEEAKKEYNECLQPYRGHILQLFLLNKDGDDIKYFTSEADFEG